MSAVHPPARPAPPDSDSRGTAGLAAALKEHTREVHEQAENSVFVSELAGGRLSLAAYTALAAQNYAIYVALEAAADQWSGDPIAGAFVLPELERVPSLQRDLTVLLGAGWREQADVLCQPATVRYTEHLRRVCADPAAFIAHHYVRYLGDLSGGQVLRAAIVRSYGDAAADAVRFYRFDAITKIKPFRDDYRRRLDDAPLTPEQHDRALVEARTAFEYNRAVFADLAVMHGLTGVL